MHRYGRILLWLVLVAPVAGAFELDGKVAGLNDEAADFLPVDQAFVMTAELADDGSLRARWQMPDGYYLYRHRFEFAVPEGSGIVLGEPEIPPGKTKVDEYFGEVQVYYHEVVARVPITRTASAGDVVEATIGYQGCADAGLCY
ncbi:MAG TPA: protein-disulfide reductase DsbD domain-containing protein, partial [Pseudomonadales bacterium]